MKVKVNFRQMLSPGAGTINDRIREHLLGTLEAADIEAAQVSRGALEKGVPWLKLVGASPTGYSLEIDGDGQGVKFPDHADYDLGRRWTIDVSYRPTSLPVSGTHPIIWRADDSNNQIVSLEIGSDGKFVLTHRDASGSETTLTSAHSVQAGETAHVRIARLIDELRIIVDGRQSAVRTNVASGEDTAPADNAWFVGIETVTDGDTAAAAASCRGRIDEFRVWREEIRDESRWAWTEYPWLADERLVLYARFNETSGDPVDLSDNENTGSKIGAPTQGTAALVTAIAPVRQLFHMRTSDGLEKWCVWAGDSMYAVGVT